MASKAGKTFQGVRSELWQRLRAARAFADKTQQDVAKVLGVSRAAVALHESRDPAIRTKPTAEQVMLISRLTGVPAEFLMSDSVVPDDVWKYADRPTNVGARYQSVSARAQQQETQPEMLNVPQPPDRLTKGFWSAVEFAVLNQDESRAECFARTIDAAGIHLVADYMHGKNIVAFCALPNMASSAAELRQFAMMVAGAVLLQERALHKPMVKHILLYSRTPADLPEIAKSAATAFGIECKVVSRVDDAASYLLSL